jgi:hypothetical protein
MGTDEQGVLTAPQPTRTRGLLARSAREVLVVVLVLVLILLMVGSAGLGIAVWLGNRPVDDRSHSLEAFDVHPEQDPIGRLGRWNGKKFVPVAPGSVQGERVTVLVHGLAQGAKSVVDAHKGPTPLLAWDAIRSDGHHEFGALMKMAQSITRAAPQRVVLAYSWIDDSAIGSDPLDARFSQARTELNGHRLAQALEEALAPGFSVHSGLQLIGHSHGARVAAIAAVSMNEPPAHLVLLDSPDNLKAQVGGASNNLAPVLRRLDLGPNGTFVDNYVSSYGVPYGDMTGLEPIIDVSLDPGRDLFGLTGHAYPLAWYERSATKVGKAVGFAWSPLRFGQADYEPPPRGEDLEQDWLHEGEPVPTRELDLRPTHQRHGPRLNLQRAGLDAHDGDAAPDDHDVVTLEEGGKTRWGADFEVDDDDVAVELTYRFTDPGDGDQLGIWIDGQLRMVTVGAWAGTEPQTVALDIANLPSGTHSLSLAVHGFGEKDAGVEATNFQKVATPGLTERSRGIVPYIEAGAVVAFVGSATALVALYVRHRRRKRARRAHRHPAPTPRAVG